MEHLSTLDAGFLEAEDSDPHVSLAIGGLSVIEGPIPDYDSLTAGIGERVRAVPRLRQGIHTHVLDLGPQEWVDDSHLDLNGSVTSMRRYAAAKVALDDVMKVCDAFDVTINDVALTAITAGRRKYIGVVTAHPQNLNGEGGWR